MPNNNTDPLPFILYLPQQICSRLLYEDAEQTATLFTMDADESISEEQQDCPSLYMMLQGELRLRLAIAQQAEQSLQRSRSQATGSQASDSQASGSQASGSQASGSQASGSQATGSQASGSQASGSQASGSQASGSQASGSQATELEIVLRAGEAVRLPAQLKHSLQAVTQCAYINMQTAFSTIQPADKGIFQSNSINHSGGNYMSNLLINKLPHGEVITLADSIEYVAGQVTSKTLVQRPELGMTLFAVDEGQQIRRHVTSGDALVQILDGTAEIEIGDSLHIVQAGQSIVIPAEIPHALYGKQSFKMLLVVVKQPRGKDELS